jgi:membrane protein implicated in regulation of membrane protease activity
MIGQRAVLIDPILASGQPGHLKIAGELWPAITEDGSPLPADTPVVVTSLRSTVLVVRAASLPPASSPSMPSA